MSKFLTWMSVEQSAATYSRVVEVMALDTSARDALLALASMSFSTGSTTCTCGAQKRVISMTCSPEKTSTGNAPGNYR